jgi:hypothetical protein
MKDWDLRGLDSKGRSRVRITGRKKEIFKLANSAPFELGIGDKIVSQELGAYFYIVNIYGPYANKVDYW